MLYYCYCSKEELEAMREKAEKEGVHLLFTIAVGVRKKANSLEIPA